MAQILVCNKVGVKGSISTIKPDASMWTHNETLEKWIVKFPNRPLNEYHRNYSLVIVSDRTSEQLLYLVEAVIIDGNPVDIAYHFTEPDSTSEEWKELFTTGQITKTFDEVELYLEAYS